MTITIIIIIIIIFIVIFIVSSNLQTRKKQQLPSQLLLLIYDGTKFPIIDTWVVVFIFYLLTLDDVATIYG